jgi:hypothetical protein
LNVIGLFNSAIPFIAIQMTALALGNQITLQFTKVLDAIEPGGEDEDAVVTPNNREEWLKRAPKSLPIADECLSILKEVVPSVALKYTRRPVQIVCARQTDQLLA